MWNVASSFRRQPSHANLGSPARCHFMSRMCIFFTLYISLVHLKCVLPLCSYLAANFPLDIRHSYISSHSAAVNLAGPRHSSTHISTSGRDSSICQVYIVHSHVHLSSHTQLVSSWSVYLHAMM